MAAESRCLNCLQSQNRTGNANLGIRAIRERDGMLEKDHRKETAGRDELTQVWTLRSETPHEMHGMVYQALARREKVEEPAATKSQDRVVADCLSLLCRVETSEGEEGGKRVEGKRYCIQVWDEEVQNSTAQFAVLGKQGQANAYWS